MGTGADGVGAPSERRERQARILVYAGHERPAITAPPAQAPAKPGPRARVPDRPTPTPPVPAGKPLLPAGRDSAEELFSREIPRFRRSERALHWAIAIPYLVCLTSGVAVKLFFNRLHSGAVTRGVLLWGHRGAGIVLLLMPILVAWRHRRELSLYLYNVKRAWSWTADDLKWLALIGLASLSKKIALPEQHKFNAGEKINFMTLMLTYPVLVGTGVFLLTPGIHFLAFIAHVSVAFLSAPLIVGHLFMAVVNPDTRIGLSGMFSGHVDREWARHHYAKWYRENFGAQEETTPASAECAAGLASRAVIVCSSCGAHTPLSSWEPLFETVAQLRPLACPACGATSAVVQATVKPEEIEAVLDDLERADVSGPDRRLTLEEGGAPDQPGAQRPPTFHPYIKVT